VVQDTITESSEDEEEDVGSKKNNKATRVLPSQNVDATSVLLSTETEGDVTGTDNDTPIQAVTGSCMKARPKGPRKGTNLKKYGRRKEQK